MEENIINEEPEGQDVVIEEGAAPGGEESVTSRPKFTGQDIAYIFANMFAPAPTSPGQELTPEQARELFIQDYTATVGVALDLVGFTDAAEKLDPGVLPAWVRVGVGVAAMVLGGVFLRAKYRVKQPNRPKLSNQPPSSEQA